MDQAADRLARAARAGEPVAIYGDYDADGVTATAILARGLRAAGARVGFHIPDRLADGYGLHAQTVARLASEGAALLVAVDCGTNARAAADAARAAGVDLVVLDHHEPVGQAASPVVLVNPKLSLRRIESSQPAEYCAAGLAYQAWRAVASLMGLDEERDDLLALAAIGTVADAVPLRGDNRILVAEGIGRLSRPVTPGIRALLEAAGTESPLGARDISHGIAPRINAAGRLADASAAVRLLVDDDPRECARIAAELNRLNQVRRDLCDRVAVEAIDQVEKEGVGGLPALVLAREGWHPGVIGIVASRLVELYHRPVVLIALGQGSGRGSARSIPGLHLVEALCEASAFLKAYGGHAMAAGLTVAEEEVGRFREAFVAAVGSRLTSEQLVPEVAVDAEILLDEVTLSLAREISRLAPFGQANPEPVFLTHDLQALSARTVGGGGHLRLLVGDGLRTAEAIGFRLGGHAELLAFTRARLDLAYTIEEDRWAGRQSVQMVVAEIRTPGLDPETVTSDAAPLLERLFERAGDYLTGEGRVIEEAPAFHTKVVGVTFEGRQSVLPEVDTGDRLLLRRAPANPRDPHAIEVCLPDGRQLGFLRASLAARLAPTMDTGTKYLATATALTGGGDRAYGLNVRIQRDPHLPARSKRGEEPGVRWPPGPSLAERLSSVLLRGRAPSATQRAIVEAMLAGRSLVVRFGPGRGLTGAAAMAALALAVTGAGPVLVVLPRPSDVDAWGAALMPRLRDAGLRAACAHGLTPPSDASALRSALGSGEMDILLASERWAQREAPPASAVIVIVDRTSGEDRLKELYGTYQGRVRLVTGPATPELLGCAATVMGVDLGDSEPAPRSNVRIVDRRGGTACDRMVPDLHSARGKTLVLAGDPRAAVEMAQRIRGQAPGLADRLAYYHAGLPDALRRALEDLFLAGRITTMVCATQLSEVLVPQDVGRVLVCGLPRSLLAATESLACAGLSGQPAVVELGYGPGELDRAEVAVEAAFPSRETLLHCYHGIRNHAGGRPWIIDGALERSLAALGVCGVTLASAIAVFLEVGLLTRGEDAEGGPRYSLAAPGERFDLKGSLRYLEGLAERQAWAGLKAWALGPLPAILAEIVQPRVEGQKRSATN